MNEKGACQSPALNHAFQAESLPFSNIPGQSKLFLDYQADPAALKRFYPNAARNLDDLRTHVREVLGQYTTNRSDLCRSLLDINERCGAGPETIANIRKLEQPDTVAVVTGQQAGLFTGPLYTIYKALSAVKTAKSLSASGVNAVPIFWIATEDHDFEEISHVEAIDAAGGVTGASIGLGANPSGTPVGNVRLDKEVAAVGESFIGELPATQFTRDLKALLDQGWSDGRSIGTAFGITLARLLSRFGLVLMDPLDPGMKRLASPIYVHAIENADAIVDALLARGNEINAAGYYNQVMVTDDYFPLFWHTDEGIRSSLRKVRDGVYRSKVDKREFTLSELADLAGQEPDRFSPGVMLRGVVQDFLLPTLCYLGGGAEIAYFAQNSESYRVLGRFVTPALHRQSFTFVESRHARTLREFGVGFTDLFAGFDALVPKIVETQISPDMGSLFADVEERINGELNRLDQSLSVLDATLAESLAKRRRKIIYHIATLRQKAYRSEMRRNEVIDRRLRTAMAALLPNGQLQERVLNFAGFYNKYGPSFFDWVYDAIDVDEKGHQLIYL